LPDRYDTTRSADQIQIRSTADPATKAPACLMVWGPLQTLLPTAVAFTTARDLMAAAAHAEADIAVIESFRETLRLDLQTIGRMVQDIRRRRAAPTGKTALRIEAVAGLHTGMPLVHVGRGSMKGELTPDEAREIALHWTQTAAAAEIDARLRYALGEWDRFTPAEVEDLFRAVRSLQR
jgi:hypothetical protein